MGVWGSCNFWQFPEQVETPLPGPTGQLRAAREEAHHHLEAVTFDSERAFNIDLCVNIEVRPTSQRERESMSIENPPNIGWRKGNPPPPCFLERG